MEAEQPVLTEIPSYLKQLARLITRGFYQIEDSLIMDMLVRNTCMKEKDIEELLKFDLKLLRARMATLKNEKLVQIRLRMETGLDGKAQKVNYYFINYKSLVNVIKYKLDHIRKRIETQARDATNRASFRCTNCTKTFTDLEAGELYDHATNQFYCTFCRSTVEEDESAVPKKDSRIMLARFNEQLSAVFELLRKAENIRLAPELLEPEPMKNPNDETEGTGTNRREGTWSGETGRYSGVSDTQIDIKIEDESVKKPAQERKERPLWMTESTVGDYDSSTLSSALTTSTTDDVLIGDKSSREDIMSVLLTFEKKDGGTSKQVIPDNDSDDDGNSSSMNFAQKQSTSQRQIPMEVDDVGVMESDDDDDQVTFVTIGSRRIPINEVTEDDIHNMSKTEKEAYIQQYQETYAHIYE